MALIDALIVTTGALAVGSIMHHIKLQADSSAVGITVKPAVVKRGRIWSV